MRFFRILLLLSVVSTVYGACTNKAIAGAWGAGGTYTCSHYGTGYCVHNAIKTACCKCGGGNQSSPTDVPTASPTNAPTIAPTSDPTIAPTSDPTIAPTSSPTVSPTSSPTVSPTSSPIDGAENRVDGQESQEQSNQEGAVVNVITHSISRGTSNARAGMLRSLKPFEGTIFFEAHEDLFDNDDNSIGVQVFVAPSDAQTNADCAANAVTQFDDPAEVTTTVAGYGPSEYQDAFDYDGSDFLEYSDSMIGAATFTLISDFASLEGDKQIYTPGNSDSDPATPGTIGLCVKVVGNTLDLETSTLWTLFRAELSPRADMGGGDIQLETASELIGFRQEVSAVLEVDTYLCDTNFERKDDQNFPFTNGMDFHLCIAPKAHSNDDSGSSNLLHSDFVLERFENVICQNSGESRQIVTNFVQDPLTILDYANGDRNKYSASVWGRGRIQSVVTVGFTSGTEEDSFTCTGNVLLQYDPYVATGIQRERRLLRAGFATTKRGLEPDSDKNQKTNHIGDRASGPFDGQIMLKRTRRKPTPKLVWVFCGSLTVIIVGVGLLVWWKLREPHVNPKHTKQSVLQGIIEGSTPLGCRSMRKMDEDCSVYSSRSMRTLESFGPGSSRSLGGYSSPITPHRKTYKPCRSNSFSSPGPSSSRSLGSFSSPPITSPHRKKFKPSRSNSFSSIVSGTESFHDRSFHDESFHSRQKPSSTRSLSESSTHKKSKGSSHRKPKSLSSLSEKPTALSPSSASSKRRKSSKKSKSSSNLLNDKPKENSFDDSSYRKPKSLSSISEKPSASTPSNASSKKRRRSSKKRRSSSKLLSDISMVNPPPLDDTITNIESTIQEAEQNPQHLEEQSRSSSKPRKPKSSSKLSEERSRRSSKSKKPKSSQNLEEQSSRSSKSEKPKSSKSLNDESIKSLEIKISDDDDDESPGRAPSPSSLNKRALEAKLKASKARIEELLSKN